MYYDGTHSVTFITRDGVSKNSWTDFHLVPSSRPVISLPEGEDFTEEVPGRDGKVDLQSIVRSQTVFKNRTGELEFIVDHENDDYRSWVVEKNDIVEFVHGKYLKMILADEPDYYYEGKFFVTAWQNNSDWTTVTISYDLFPYKKSVIASTDAWKWDPFNFVTGYIHDAQDFRIMVRGSVENEITIERLKYPTHIKLLVDFPNYSSTTIFMEVKRYTATGEEVTERGYISKVHGVWEFILYPDYPRFTMNIPDSAASGTTYIVFNEEAV